MEQGWRSPFLILKVFIAFLLTLLGLGMLYHAQFVGAVFAAAGLTFFFFLWAANRRMP